MGDKDMAPNVETSKRASKASEPVKPIALTSRTLHTRSMNAPQAPEVRLMVPAAGTKGLGPKGEPANEIGSWAAPVACNVTGIRALAEFHGGAGPVSIKLLKRSAGDVSGGTEVGTVSVDKGNKIKPGMVITASLPKKPIAMSEGEVIAVAVTDGAASVAGTFVITFDCSSK